LLVNISGTTATLSWTATQKQVDARLATNLH
jgi:hypothetical protein